MPEFLTTDPAPALFCLLTVAVMFVLFIRESYPTEVVALGGAAFMLVSGVLPVNDLLGVLSNPAPWTVGAMFILSGALIDDEVEIFSESYRVPWNNARTDSFRPFEGMESLEYN